MRSRTALELDRGAQPFGACALRMQPKDPPSGGRKRTIQGHENRLHGRHRATVCVRKGHYSTRAERAFPPFGRPLGHCMESALQWRSSQHLPRHCLLRQEPRGVVSRAPLNCRAAAEASGRGSLSADLDVCGGLESRLYPDLENHRLFRDLGRQNVFWTHPVAASFGPSPKLL